MLLFPEKPSFSAIDSEVEAILFAGCNLGNPQNAAGAVRCPVFLKNAGRT